MATKIGTPYFIKTWLRPRHLLVTLRASDKTNGRGFQIQNRYIDQNMSILLSMLFQSIYDIELKSVPDVK